jgi:hypothetical protein
LKWIGGLFLVCLVLGIITAQHDDNTPQARQEQAEKDALTARWAAYHNAHPNAYPDDETVLTMAHIQTQQLFNNPNDIEWLNERVVDVDPGVACGEVRARNGFGALTLSHYVYGGMPAGLLLFLTSEQDGYSRAYTHYCSNRQPLNGEPPRS